MANDNINLLEEEDADNLRKYNLEKDALQASNPKVKIIIAVVSSLIIAMFIAIFFMLSDDDEYDQNMNLSKELEHQLKGKKIIPPSELETIIKKANILYAKGNKKEALYLFKKIAIYSESISYYNLGVARMKNDQFSLAIQAFKKAIAKNEKVCVSSINIAVSALKLGDKKLFKYYIDLASLSLQNEHDSALYSYYKALIEFYKNRPLEALSALKHRTSNYFKAEQDYIRAKMAFSLNDSLQSSTYLEQAINDDDFGALGMLYARLGNLNLATKMLKKALKGGYKTTKHSLALAHVYLKNGYSQKAGEIYKSLYDLEDQNYTKLYPIKVFLNLQEFNLKKRQTEYLNHSTYSNKDNFEIFIHFAPYKIFDAFNTVGFIKKGSANIYMDDIKSAKQYLSKSTNFSKINQIIASAINDTLNLNLQLALNKLSKAYKNYSKHSILNYNLALTYAKLGNLQKANEFFVKSYNLNAKNYLAGIFAIMSGEIIGNNSKKLQELFNENLFKEIETKDIAFVKALLYFKNREYSRVSQWSQEQKLNKNMEYALMLLTSKYLNEFSVSSKYALQLVQSNNKDILSHLLFMHVNYGNLSTKKFINRSLNYLRKLNFSLNEIFYGSHIIKKFFVNYTFITGFLYDLSKKLKKQINIKNQNLIPDIKALAYSKIYLQQFEEAFVLYNQLIDEQKQQDSNTLLFAALAATGAKHYANAISLFELANLKSRYNPESRYALGLLYLQTKNYNAASIQFSKVYKKNFKSKYFTFKIDSKSIGSHLIQ